MLLSDLASSLHLLFTGKDCEITSLGMLKDASNSQVAYCESEKFIEELKQTKAAAVLVQEALVPYVPSSTYALITPTPHLMMAYASALFYQKPFDTSKPAFISPLASIASGVVLGSQTRVEEGSYIMANVTIGANVLIGKNVMIYPNVVIYDNSVLKDGCIVQAGAVIGGDGFGYAHTSKGEHIKIHHSGNVVLEEEVEIGANTTIDRAVFGSTVIKKGTKIDNLVQIGHNCEIGQHSIIVSQAGISGSTKLGRNVIMGGQSATAGHIEIGDFAIIAARGGVSKSIQGGKTYGGFPLSLQSEWLKTQAKISRFFKKN